jgi:hypothetical protein
MVFHIATAIENMFVVLGTIEAEPLPAPSYKISFTSPILVQCRSQYTVYLLQPEVSSVECDRQTVLSFPDGVQDHIALQLLLSESWKN